MENFDFAFFWHGPDTRIPSCLVGSIRMAYGNSIRIFQLSRVGEVATPGIDRLYEFDLPKPTMLARAKAAHMLQIERQTVFIDADMILLDKLDLPEISDKEVGTVTRAVDAIADGQDMRLYPELFGKSLNSTMPYVGCFLYTRSRRFLTRIAETMESQPPNLQRWFGDQLAIKQHLSGGKFRSIPLDPMKYNHPLKSPLLPQQLFSLRNVGTKILHAKGHDGKLENLMRTAASLQAISSGQKALSSSGV